MGTYAQRGPRIEPTTTTARLTAPDIGGPSSTLKLAALMDLTPGSSPKVVCVECSPSNPSTQGQPFQACPDAWI
jgi:hypothetical protein